MTAKEIGKTKEILQSFSYLTLGKTIGDVFTFVLFVFFSRVFGQEGIGQYSFAMAFSGFFAVFADFGLQGLCIRELSRLDDKIANEAGRFLTLRFVLSTIAFMALAVLMPILPFSFETKIIVILIGLYQILYRILDGFLTIYIAREDNHIAGLLDTVFRGSTALVGCTIILLKGEIVTTVASLPVMTAFQVLISYGLVMRRYGAPTVARSWYALIRMARESIPFAMALLLDQIRSRIGVVFLTFILDAAAAGIYNVAYRVIFMLSFIPHFGALALFPYTSRLFVQSRSELPEVYTQALNVAIIIGLPLSAGVWLVAPDLMQIVFGDDFTTSIAVLRLLAWLLFLTFTIRIMTTFLYSCELQVDVTRMQWIAGVANILGSVVFIIYFGLLGAAVGTLIAECLLVILYFRRLNSVLGRPKIMARLFISSAGAASFCILFSIIDGLSLFIVIPASVGIYLLTLFMFKETRLHELTIGLNMIRGK